MLKALIFFICIRLFYEAYSRLVQCGFLVRPLVREDVVDRELRRFEPVARHIAYEKKITHTPEPSLSITTLSEVVFSLELAQCAVRLL